MFFDPERINTMRKVIVSENKSEREEALSQLLPHQQKDFIELFKIMHGLPVNIRLLDPPLHEFLPHNDTEIENLAHEMGVGFSVLKNRVLALEESNPMLGHRGCRLAVTYPEIYNMQVRAIFKAIIELSDYQIEPEIMIPLVLSARELQIIKDNIDEDCF